MKSKGRLNLGGALIAALLAALGLATPAWAGPCDLRTGIGCGATSPTNQTPVEIQSRTLPPLAVRMREILIKDGTSPEEADKILCSTNSSWCAPVDDKTADEERAKKDKNTDAPAMTRIQPSDGSPQKQVPLQPPDETPPDEASPDKDRGRPVRGKGRAAPTDPAATARDAAAERSRAAMTRSAKRMTGAALTAADRLRSPAPDLSGGGAGAAGASTGGMSRESGEKDLALAAVSGYKGAFDALGLRVGRDAAGTSQILRADGSRASATEIARLRATIASEPAALQRQPDFFRHISRENFSQLKLDYRGRPEERARVFRDVELSAGNRDFSWGRSCARVSGDCSAFASAGSYVKSDFVPAPDLAGMSVAMRQADKAQPAATQEGDLTKLLKASEYTEEDEAEAQQALDSERRAGEKQRVGMARAILRAITIRTGFSGTSTSKDLPDGAATSHDSSIPSPSRGWFWGERRSADISHSSEPSSPDRGAPTLAAAPAETPASGMNRMPAWLLFSAMGAAVLFLGIRGARGRD